MADSDRTTARALTWMSELEAEPWSFSFYQALRRIDAAHPNLPPIGCAVRLSEDPVRLAQEISLRFAPSSVASFTGNGNGRGSRLAVNFFGLLGPQGPLPLHLTEYAYDRIHQHGDTAFVSFLDIFHHRTLSLYYRCWAAAQPITSFDRPWLDRFGCYVASTFGYGMPSLQNRDSLPDSVKRYYAGLLAVQTRHATGLATILADYFGLPSKIEEFVGHWMTVPVSEQWRLGDMPSQGFLGESTLLGSKIWDQQNRFRVILGPMSYEAYCRLLPQQPNLRKLTDWVRLYVGDALAWDLGLVLRCDQVPPLRLGLSGQLGWSTWLGNDVSRDTDPWMRLSKDAADLVLDRDWTRNHSAADEQS